jgi:energy-coupling factor transporter transmembrane protein EcfT
VTEETNEIVSSLSISVGAFFVPLLTAYVCGRLADERYLTYALYSLIGFLVLSVPGILYSGIFGFLVVGFGILGAINGASLAARRAMRRRREIYGPEDKGEEKTT